VFFCLKDLLHTTTHQNVLLSEQTQLQMNISEWIERFENCQKETESKQQQLQVLQDEIKENKLKLDQQEMVLHSMIVYKGNHCVLL
jgi:centriolin